jgi:hypothetical protein
MYDDHHIWLEHSMSHPPYHEDEVDLAQNLNVEAI